MYVYIVRGQRSMNRIKAANGIEEGVQVQGKLAMELEMDVTVRCSPSRKCRILLRIHRLNYVHKRQQQQQHAFMLSLCVCVCNPQTQTGA